MASEIVDLTAQRGGVALLEPLLHPAGVKLPFDGPSDAALIIPEIRSDLRSGAYSAEIIALLEQAVEPGDRVLVIGAGLGVVSTLVAKTEGVARVIAIEANTTLIDYLNRVHELNGVPQVEAVNAVLAEGKQGRVPFFARRDLRLSSLLPHDRSWQQVMMVPFMDLNLILAEERISLVISDIPVTAAQLVAQAELAAVERVLINSSDDTAACWEDGGACSLLLQRGFVPEPAGGAVLFRRASGYVRPAPDARLERAAKEAAEGDLTDEDLTDDDLTDDDLTDEDDLTDGDDLTDEDAESAAEKDEVAKDEAAKDEAAKDKAAKDKAAKDETADDEIAPEAAAANVAAEPSARGAGGDSGADGPAPDADAGDDSFVPPELVEAQDAPGAGTEATPEAASAAARAGDRPQEIETEWDAEARRAEGAGHTLSDHFAALFEDLPGARGGHDDDRVLPDEIPDFSDEPPGAAARDGGAGWSARLWGLATLALLMALPLIGIGEFAGSRAERQAAATAETLATWGGAQTLTGPYLVIPVEAAGAAAQPLVVLPDRLEIASRLEAGLRSNDILALPVYRGRHAVSFDFGASGLDETRLAALLAAGETLRWDRALLGFGITDPRALKDAPVLTFGTTPVPFEPGSGAEGIPGIHAPTGDPRGRAVDWSFTLDLDGSGGFRVTPAGRLTEGRIDATWHGTGIRARATGAFRPDSVQAGDDGLAARWAVPQLAHGMPRAFRGTGALDDLAAADFGLALRPAADLYAGTARAAKFGFLLILLSFGVLLLIERSAGRAPNPVQYALVGAAQCLFFVLLLPLAETIGAGLAFLLAAAATVGLLTAYGWAGIGLGARSLWLSATMAALYAVMYLILAGAGHLALTGSAIGFAVLAVAMWLTRGNPDLSALAAFFPRSSRAGRPDSPAG